jgi:transcriptional regulator with XRE-family HTH domain
MSRTAVSELETGRRKSVSVHDLVILAAALGVPPLQLIYPEQPGGEVEYLPGVTVTSIAAAQHFSGEVPIVKKGMRRTDTAVMEKSRRWQGLKGKIRLLRVQSLGEDLAAEDVATLQAATEALSEVESEMDSLAMRYDG